MTKMHFSPRNPNFRLLRISFQAPLNSDYAEFTLFGFVTPHPALYYSNTHEEEAGKNEVIAISDSDLVRSLKN